MLGSDVLVGGRYRLVERIGLGGMAEVWRAVDTADGRAVAVKLLAEGTGDLRRFAAEVRVLSRLYHPAVVRFLGAGDLHGRPYLVMDLVEGETLADRLARGPLTAGETARLGVALAGALAAAHQVGIVHRDVKPANVLLDHEGRARLADFGVSRLAGAATITGTGWVVGTAGYLAPEQVDGGPAGPASDVYALGLVLLECLTGQRAFPGAAVATAAARLTRDPDVPPGLPEPWPRLLAAMTARPAGARPSAAAVAAALGGPRAAPPAAAPTVVAAGAGPEATRVLPVATPVAPARPAPARPARGRPVAPARRPPSLVLVGAVLLALGLLALLLAMALDVGREPVGDGSTPTTAGVTTPATATTAPPTTAPPTTAAPTTAAPTTEAPVTLPPTTLPPLTDDDEGEGGEGEGRGNGRGGDRGNGRGDGGDDD